MKKMNRVMLTAAAVLSAGVFALSGLSVTAGAEENAAAAAEAPAGPAVVVLAAQVAAVVPGPWAIHPVR